MMYKGLYLFLLLLSVATMADAQCNWTDGADNSLTSDGGRGVTDWTAHQNYAATTNDLGMVATFVRDRMKAASGCLGGDSYARLYADLSVRIADHGIANAGWTNSLRNTALPNDGGCGYKDWNAHFGYAKANAAAVTSDLVYNRLAALASTPRPAYSALYADLSLIVTNYTINRSGNYLLKNRKSGYYVTVDNLSMDKGHKIIQWKDELYTNGGHQDWNFKQLPNGFYSVTNKRSNLLLTVNMHSLKPGEIIIQWNDEIAANDAHQEWGLVKLKNGMYALKNRKSGLLLTVSNHSTKPAEQLIQWTDELAGNDGHQEWALAAH